MSNEVRLFQPLTIRDQTFANRVAVAPMCQYSAIDGVAQDWHLQHYGSLVASGPGLVVIEATGVSADGRISPGCLGLYSEACEAGFARLVTAVKSFGSSKIGVQLGHAGRKASSNLPWAGNGAVAPEQGGWQPVAPSPLAFSDAWPVPTEIGAYDFDRLRLAFANAAERADRAGIDVVEIHSAHGYLLHQFLSPLTNRRTDAYGGKLDGRMRFPMEIVRAVRRAWPTGKPLGIRISATDWVEGGFTPDEAVIYLQACRAEGVDYVCVSSGGLVPDAKIPVGPGYQVALAAKIKAETGLITRAVGMIADPHQAEDILEKGQADMVALGRAFLDDPRWCWRAAEVLGADHPLPPQYLRAGPKLWPGSSLKKPSLVNA